MIFFRLLDALPAGAVHGKTPAILSKPGVFRPLRHICAEFRKFPSVFALFPRGWLVLQQDEQPGSGMESRTRN